MTLVRSFRSFFLFSWFRFGGFACFGRLRLGLFVGFGDFGLVVSVASLFSVVSFYHDVNFSPCSG